MIFRYLVKPYLLNRFPFVFVETVLERIILDPYGSQWSPRRPLAGASGNRKVYLQFLFTCLIKSKLP